MDAKELRIGNIVANFDFNPEFTIRDGEDIEDHAEHNCYQPITLTEEWPLKWGFEKTELEGVRLYTILYDDRSEFILYEANRQFYIRHNGSTVFIKTVHRLQNIFYGITEQELHVVK